MQQLGHWLSLIEKNLHVSLRSSQDQRFFQYFHGSCSIAFQLPCYRLDHQRLDQIAAGCRWLLPQPPSAAGDPGLLSSSIQCNHHMRGLNALDTLPEAQPLSDPQVERVQPGSGGAAIP